MPDIYASITAADPATLERLVAALELRAADLLQRGILKDFVSEITLPKDAKVLEIGCGTGAVTRFLADLPKVSQALGVDPSPVFIAKARELAGEAQNLTFQEADGRTLPCEDCSFDLWCSTPACAIFRSRRKRLPRLFGCSILEARLRFSMAITPRRRLRSEISIPYNAARTQRSTALFMIAGWCVGSPRCCGPAGSNHRDPAVTATLRFPNRAICSHWSIVGPICCWPEGGSGLGWLMRSRQKRVDAQRSIVFMA